MEKIVDLFIKERKYICKKNLNIHNFVDPFVSLIINKINRECILKNNSLLEKSIKKNCKKELFSYLPKLLVTESYIYKIENNLDVEDMNKFIHSIYYDEKQLLNLLKLYPFLFSFLLKRCSYIADIYIEVIEKVENDYEDLIKIGMIREKEELIAIDRESGDSHNKGKKVMELKFNTNCIFYKPKNSNLTKILFDIQEWIEDRSDLKFYKYNILNRETYSYEEKVEHNLVEDSLTLNKYYYNFGVTLGLIYILNGTDYHFENIIAHDEFPVMIDNETLFNPALSEYNIDTHFLSSGMLPNSNNNIDFSTLSGSLSNQTVLIEQLVENKNSFILEKRDFFINKRKNYPSNEVDFSYIYKKEKRHILLGFKELLSIFIKHKEEFLDSNLIKKLQNEKIRIVVRHTMYYNELLTKLFHPYHIKDINTACKFLEKHLSQNSYLNDLQPYEEKQLLNGDIPIFHMYMENTHLEENNSYIVSKYSPMASLITKISSLKPKTLLLSENIILNILNASYKEKEYG